MPRKSITKKNAPKTALVSVQIPETLHRYFREQHDETGIPIRFAISKVLEKHVREIRTKPPK